MNHFTKSNTVVTELHEDLCEHLQIGDKAIVHTERDSFGPVGEVILCQDCEDERLKEEAEVQVICHDCKQEHPRSQTIAWKWYDFYAAQGDEPLTICDACRVADKHQARVRADEREYCLEHGIPEEEELHSGGGSDDWIDEIEDFPVEEEDTTSVQAEEKEGNHFKPNMSMEQFLEDSKDIETCPSTRPELKEDILRVRKRVQRALSMSPPPMPVGDFMFLYNDVQRLRVYF